MMDFDRRHALLAALIVLAAVGAVGAQTFLFTAGSGGTINATDGPAVTLGEDLGLTGSNPVGADGSVTIQDSTVDGPAGSSATLTAPSSSAPTLESIDTVDGTVEAESDGIQTVGIEGSVTELTYRDATLNDDAVDFDVTTTGSGTLYVHGQTPGEQIVAYDGDTIVDISAVNSSGVVEVNIDNSGTYALELDTTEGPTVEDATASPRDGAVIGTAPVDIQVNVSHPNSGDTGFDDTLTAEWYHNGSLVETTTESVGEISNSLDNVAAGSESWSVTVTDAYGTSDSSDTYEFGVPDELAIRPISDTGGLIDDVEVSINVYGDDDVFGRNTSDGAIDMTGLPPDQPLVVVAEADGYRTRQVIIDSIIDQQSIYMLSNETDSVEVRFTIADITGTYSEDDSQLFIERPLTINGSTEYVTVAADEFGVNGYSTVLEQEQRYRLIVRNEDGDERTVGSYSPTVAETVNLEIGDSTFEFDMEDSSVQWDAGFDSENDEVTFGYNDPQDDTDRVDLRIYERGNESNVIAEETWTDASEVTFAQPADNSTTWVVEWEAEQGGETIGASRPVGSGRLNVAPDIDDRWTTIAGVGMLFVVGGLFGAARPEVGAIVVSALGAILWMVGWMPGATTGLAVVVANFVAVLFYVRRPR